MIVKVIVSKADSCKDTPTTMDINVSDNDGQITEKGTVPNELLCDQCDKMFGSQNLLDMHTKFVHSGDKMEPKQQSNVNEIEHVKTNDCNDTDTDSESEDFANFFNSLIPTENVPQDTDEKKPKFSENKQDLTFDLATLQSTNDFCIWTMQ